MLNWTFNHPISIAVNIPAITGNSIEKITPDLPISTLTAKKYPTIPPNIICADTPMLNIFILNDTNTDKPRGNSQANFSKKPAKLVNDEKLPSAHLLKKSIGLFPVNNKINQPIKRATTTAPIDHAHLWEVLTLFSFSFLLNLDFIKFKFI